MYIALGERYTSHIHVVLLASITDIVVTYVLTVHCKLQTMQA